MTNILSLKRALELARHNVLAAKDSLDDYEIDTDSQEFIRVYEDYLDGCRDAVFGIEPSRILRECDPTAYRCGANDYADGLDKEDFTEYRERKNDLEEAEQALADAQEALDSAEGGAL